MTCVAEKDFERLCHKYDIAFTRPERDPRTPSTLDFYLPDYQLSVEVKLYSAARIHDQILRSGEENIMVLVGRRSVAALDKLLHSMESRQEP